MDEKAAKDIYDEIIKKSIQWQLESKPTVHPSSIVHVPVPRRG